MAAAVLLAASVVTPPLVARRLNRLVSPAVVANPGPLHRQLLVADLHADSLFWGRDLSARSRDGHVDLPRLREGGVALQVFGVFTKVPWKLNIERNAGDHDSLTPLVLLARWPPRTWSSLLERALYQAARLQALAEGSQGGLRLLHTHADLEQVLAERRAGRPTIGAVLGLEGAHALEGRAENVDPLERAGFRLIGLAHFFDNEFAGSAHGLAKGGLTDLGRALVRRAGERGLLIDLAHASPAAFREAVQMARGPVVVSHTGVRGTCDNARNLSDEQLRAVAATGGVVGIGFWETAVCGEDVRAVARAIRHAVSVAGPEHVALGSDFDGATTTPFDASGLGLLTDALTAAGLPEGTVRAVMGENVHRVLAGALPRKRP